MSRILSIDYGQKKVGIAVTDTEQIIATGLITIRSIDVVSFLEDYMQKENVSCFVIGEAKRLDGSPSQSSEFIEPFVKKIAKKFPNILIERFDERFTSKIAFQTMIQSGISKKARRNKDLIDKISATIILQSYLTFRSL